MTQSAAFALFPKERQLFLDGRGIARLENLKRTLHQPAKKGAVIRPEQHGSLRGAVQTRSAPLWDPEAEIYRFWLCASERPYYESRDGFHWYRLAGDPGEEQQRCTVRGQGGRFKVELVVRDPNDPDPARRYKAALPNAGFAVSANGSRWEMLGAPGVRSSDEYNFSFDEQGNLFILTVKRRGPYGRAVWLSKSHDLARWTDPALVFCADDPDQLLGREQIAARLTDPALEPRRADEPAAYNVDVYNMGVFRYESVYLGTPALFHSVAPTADGRNTVGFHLVQLVCSRDLAHWQRVGQRRPFIGPSPRGAGAYDLTQIIGPSAPVARGDELWFYYTGLKYRDEYQESERADLDPDAGAICLAVLRRDGFVSLDAGSAEGVLETAPFLFPGGSLCANLAALGGELRAQIVGVDGQVLATSAPLEGDRVRGQFAWTQGHPERARGRQVFLRFAMRQGSFYSYWVE